jgi:hypothetical protein
MPPHDFEEYLQFLAAVLRVRKSRQEEIFSELRDHFAERVAELQAEGADRERAAAVAQQEFGDAAALAAQFVEVIRQRKRRIVMRSTVGATAAALVVIMAALTFWPGGRGLSPLAAEEKSPKVGAADKQTAALLADAERDRATREKLAKPGEAEFVEQPLPDVLDYFKDCCKVQIYVKRRSVEEQGIDPGTAKVTFSMKGVPMSRILQLILDNFKLDYMIQDGIVIISTPEDLEGQTITKVYNLQHYLGVTPSTQEVRNLIQVITETVLPQSWDEQGGPGSIQSLESPKIGVKSRAVETNVGLMEGAVSLVKNAAGKNNQAAPSEAPTNVPAAETVSAPGNFQGLIVVTQTAKAHERICELLDQIRVAMKQKGVQ